MKVIACVIAGLTLIASTVSFAGDVYKCVDADGKVSFSDTSCPPAAQEQRQTATQAEQATQDVEHRPEPKRGVYGEYIDRSRAVEKELKKPE